MKRKSTIERIKTIQKHLAIQADGMVGPDTLTAIENRLFSVTKEMYESFTLVVSRSGLKQLVSHEVSSKYYYNRYLKQPIWPGGYSGVTIGIGYDLGYNRVSQIQRDWLGKISDRDLETLKKVSGIKGSEAKKELSRLKMISIPFDTAEQVFSVSTLPRYAALTQKAYPGVEKLQPDAQAALLSLVYNRGSSMSGSRRKEMAAIRPLVVRKDYAAMAQEILNMKRLWIDRGLTGLLRRREDEAELLGQANRDYDEFTLIRV